MIIILNFHQPILNLYQIKNPDINQGNFGGCFKTGVYKLGYLFYSVILLFTTINCGVIPKDSTRIYSGV